MMNSGQRSNICLILISNNIFFTAHLHFKHILTLHICDETVTSVSFLFFFFFSTNTWYIKDVSMSSRINVYNLMCSFCMILHQCVDSVLRAGWPLEGSILTWLSCLLSAEVTPDSSQQLWYISTVYIFFYSITKINSSFDKLTSLPFCTWEDSKYLTLNVS